MNKKNYGGVQFKKTKKIKTKKECRWVRELEKRIQKDFGTRCPDYNPFCANCIMWHALETIKEGYDF